MSSFIIASYICTGVLCITVFMKQSLVIRRLKDTIDLQDRVFVKQSNELNNALAECSHLKDEIEKLSNDLAVKTEEHQAAVAECARLEHKIEEYSYELAEARDDIERLKDDYAAGNL